MPTVAYTRVKVFGSGAARAKRAFYSYEVSDLRPAMSGKEKALTCNRLATASHCTEKLHNEMT